MKRIVVIALFLVNLSWQLSVKASSAASYKIIGIQAVVVMNQSRDTAAAFIEKDRATALFLAVTVGILGVHRWYLGTSTTTLVAYVVTLGGFGIVTVIDIIQLITAKDVSSCFDNPEFFMWNKKPSPSFGFEQAR